MVDLGQLGAFIDNHGIASLIVVAYIAERWKWLGEDIKSKRNIATSLALINNILEIKERQEV